MIVVAATTASFLRTTPATKTNLSPSLPNLRFSTRINCVNEAVVIDGSSVAKKIKNDIAVEILRMKEAIGVVPGLAVILVGDNSASASYVKAKKKACKSIGMNSFGVHLPHDCSESQVIENILRFNDDPAVNGILVQLPLPSHLNEENVLNAICIEKDVDGFNPLNIGLLAMKGRREPLFVACTPKGCIELLKRYNIPMKGRNAVVIGRSNIVGTPTAFLLQREQATVTVIHSNTENSEKIVREADIVIVAAGKPNMVKGSWIKPGAVVIDVGFHRVEGANAPAIGDVCYDEVSKIASAITPVPGGVGPMTIAMLLYNTLVATKRAYNINLGELSLLCSELSI